MSHSIEAVLAGSLVLRVPAHDAAALRTVLEVVCDRVKILYWNTHGYALWYMR